MKKYTVAATSAVFTLAVFAICTFSACFKDDCLSEVIRARHKNDVCSTDCSFPVIGCDSKQYCNLCEANKNGVSYVK